MTPFATSVLIAAVWIVLTGRLDLPNLALGLFFGLIVLYATRGIWEGAAYYKRIVRLLLLLAWSLVELFSAALIEAVSVLLPGKRRMIRAEIPITLRNDREIALLAGLVSVTPRTLVIGLAGDRSKLIVHTSAKNRSALETRIAQLLEPEIRETAR